MKIALFLLALWCVACQPNKAEQSSSTGVSLVVLGIAQDAGAPHIGCVKACCKSLTTKHQVVSLGVVDHNNQKNWLFEATPDLTEQLKELNEYANHSGPIPNGIILTHAHIGHYSGLMYLGKEALGAKQAPVLCLPKMKSFLQTNGPWSQLVNDSNIVLHQLLPNRDTALSNQLAITPLLVPHRDEYSETAGYLIKGPNKTALFIPDIDKWNKWEQDITEVIQQVDYAFIDGTFYDKNELPHRNIEEIPHPFISESIELFSKLNTTDKNKVFFIHFNHTNPLLQINSEAYNDLIAKGFNIARKGDQFDL